jgi:mannose-6-phosphate isomerase-like protein (cupin superfamily)
MIYDEAEAILAETLAPLAPEAFFAAVGKHCLDVDGSAAHPRRSLFGNDPKRTVLNAYSTHSSELDCHAKAPTQPAPKPRPVSDADEFLELIRAFHERGYTVRVPDVLSLAPDLQRFARALEFMLRQPVTACLFWSAAGAQAIVHYDKRDNIIIQLEGRKRWFISTDPPGLQNNWKHVGEPLPHLQRHRVVDVGPGDLLYIPRGTPHTVESTTESLHLAVLFEPITVREAIIAALDYLSDHDPAFRHTAVRRMQHADLHRVSEDVLAGLSRLAAQCRSEDFVRQAMDMRASRMTSDLPVLPKPTAPAKVARDTLVRQSPFAISFIRPSFDSLDFSQPGGHIALHPGVAPELNFIASTKSFRVADIPGGSAEEVKIAIVSRLIESGFLETAS